jgi:hypothetical protein
MKFVVSACALALTVSGLVVSSRVPDDSNGPIGKVLVLLKDLQIKISEDFESELKMYNKLACWCHTFSNTQANNIEGAHEDYENLGRRILSVKGGISTLEFEIAQLNADVEKEQGNIAQAERIRGQQHESHEASVGVDRQAIASLQEAITILLEAQGGDHGTEPAMLQQTSRARDLVRSTIRVLPSTGAFSAEKLSLLTSFAADPAPFQSPDKNYASQLDTVVGILKEMYANFAADLETLWTTEGQRQRGHELLVASKQTTINEYLATVAEKSATTANLNEILAQAESSYQETKEYIDVSTHEFDAGKDLCQRKHSEFTERNSLYDNEKEAVAKAIAILSTDAARSTFETAITAGAETRDVAFLQTSAGAQEPSARAVQILKIGSRNSKSLRLASIAALIQQTPTGHFDAVMQSIDEMVQVLIDEQSADKVKRDDCVETFHNIALTTEKENHTVITSQRKIESTDAKIAMNLKEIGELNNRISLIESQVAAINANAEERIAVFEKSQTDDTQAIQILQEAIGALFHFHSGRASLLQQRRSDQDPVGDKDFEVSYKDAPNTTFSDRKVHTAAANNIVSILEMVKTDLEHEFAADAVSEAESKASDKERLAALASEKTICETQISTLETSNFELASVKQGAVETQNDATAHIARLADERTGMTVDCEFITKNYDARQAKRTTEQNALTQAKSFLAGYKPAAFAQMSHSWSVPVTQRHSFKFLG